VTHVVVTLDVRSHLKKEKFESELSESIEIPGLATGLAVTSVGGDILFIEATRMKGKGGLTLTGQLGDVMRESAQIAHSYVRSKAEPLGVDPTVFESTDVHLHVPAGAIPKDGRLPGGHGDGRRPLRRPDGPRRGDREVPCGRVLPVGNQMKVLAAIVASPR
jgi:ATP-dependent Lon protease